MNHLTDEQFENIMQGKDSPPEHLNHCLDCQNLLAEKKALAQRLRLAFNSVQASPDLADRVRTRLRQSPLSSQPAEPARSDPIVRTHRRFWSGLAAAAAILVVAIPLGLYLTSTSQANAAQAELVKIHYHSIEPHDEFYTDDDPEKLAEYFINNLGFPPAFPRLGQGLEIRGCCIRHFRGQMVGSYVVETPSGSISIIVVTDTPQSMNMTQIPIQTESGKILWKGSFARCEMVTVRLGNYSYCAVGEVSHEILTDLISRLLS